MRFCNNFYYKLIAHFIKGSFWNWNPGQLHIFSMEVKIYIEFWTLKVKCIQLIWDLWISGLQEYKGNDFFEVGRVDNNYRSGLENLSFMDGWLPLSESTSPLKFMGGGSLTSSWKYS